MGERLLGEVEMGSKGSLGAARRGGSQSSAGVGGPLLILYFSALWSSESLLNPCRNQPHEVPSGSFSTELCYRLGEMEGFPVLDTPAIILSNTLLTQAKK